MNSHVIEGHFDVQKYNVLSIFLAYYLTWLKILMIKYFHKLSNFDPNKRYSMIDQHLARHFKNNGASLLSSPPFLCKQIINPFSHLMLFANQERGLCIQLTVESVYPYSSSILQFLLPGQISTGPLLQQYPEPCVGPVHAARALYSGQTVDCPQILLL